MILEQQQKKKTLLFAGTHNSVHACVWCVWYIQVSIPVYMPICVHAESRAPDALSFSVPLYPIALKGLSSMNYKVVGVLLVLLFPPGWLASEVSGSTCPCHQYWGL